DQRGLEPARELAELRATRGTRGRAMHGPVIAHPQRDAPAIAMLARQRTQAARCVVQQLADTHGARSDHTEHSTHRLPAYSTRDGTRIFGKDLYGPRSFSCTGLHDVASRWLIELPAPCESSRGRVVSRRWHACCCRWPAMRTLLLLG